MTGGKRCGVEWYIVYFDCTDKTVEQNVTEKYLLLWKVLW